MTQIDNYRKKIERFIEDNPDLVGEYDSTQDNIPLKYSIDDIIEQYELLHRSDKDCSLLGSLNQALRHANEYGVSITDAYDNLQARASIGQYDSENIIQSYFNDVRDTYTRNNNDFDIEYCEENRDRLLEMNLKTVISIAKKYQGLGLELADLISAGNVGLVTAWEKFDPTRNKVKELIINKINDLNNTFSTKTFKRLIDNIMDYGDIKQKILSSPLMTSRGRIRKEDALAWVEANIPSAKFNSIAVMWIRAYILIELDKHSRMVKKPKSEILMDKEKYGAYKKESLVNIDEPIGDEDGATIGDRILGEVDDPSDLEIGEAYDIFKDGLKKLLAGTKVRDRSIFLKKFGIGIPRPMSPKEIAEQEGLSIARVSQILQNVMETIHKNQVKYDVDPEVLFEAVQKFQ